MTVTITVSYSTKTDVVREAGVAGRTFVDDDVEGVIRGIELIINNHTSKTTVAPWTSANVETWGIVTEACRIGSAGVLMQRFPSLVESGKAKVDFMYKILSSFVYGESTTSGGSEQRGDVIVTAGSFENNEFEDLVNLDINADKSLGTH